MGILEKKVALVTGAGQGCGRGSALALAWEGAAVAVVGRTESKLIDTANTITERGGKATPIVCDVTQYNQIEACVSATIGEFGTVDILVNTAQSPSQRSAPLLNIPRADIQELWESGPVATLEFMRCCYPYLKGGGSIVNFGTGAMLGPRNFGVYAGIKSAINMLTRAAAEEWGHDGIRANLVVPFAESPAFREHFADDPTTLESVLKSIPVGRVGDPETDVGRAVVFLVGPDSSYITGTTLMVDGGMMFLR